MIVEDFINVMKKEKNNDNNKKDDSWEIFLKEFIEERKKIG
jgi:hypothetical protein